MLKKKIHASLTGVVGTNRTEMLRALANECRPKANGVILKIRWKGYPLLQTIANLIQDLKIRVIVW